MPNGKPKPAESNTYSGSTTFEWRRVKIARPPEANGNSRPKGGLSYFKALSPFDWRRRPLTMTVVYRGGAECWVEIRSRGGVLRRPGVTSLIDVVAELANRQP